MVCADELNYATNMYQSYRTLKGELLRVNASSFVCVAHDSQSLLYGYIAQYFTHMHIPTHAYICMREKFSQMEKMKKKKRDP